jgi:hypothetical protein
MVGHQKGSTREVMSTGKGQNKKGLCALERKTIYEATLTEAAEPGDGRKECNEKEIASVKPPCSPEYHRVSQIQLQSIVN